MSTPINLNKVRKARADAKVRADSNALAFGRSKFGKEADAKESSRKARELDGKALETPPYGADSGNKKP